MRDIKDLYYEFKSIKNYKERLAFYDRHFIIQPLELPAFDASLSLLMTPEGISTLTDIFHREQVTSIKPQKTFIVDKDEITFSAVPANSNRQFFNEYILSKFITGDQGFETTLQQIVTKAKSGEKAEIELCLKKAQETIDIIKTLVNDINERTNRRQFMMVFYEGYNDYRLKSIKQFHYKKKLLELYLYSHGILYGKYIENLASYSLEFTQGSKHEHIKSGNHLSLNDKVKLIKELGIVEFLKKEHSRKRHKNMDDKIMKFIRLITDEEEMAAKNFRDYILKAKTKK
jgi:hypothetical protein